MILVIGAGGMGSVIAQDLAQNHEVTVIDSSRESLDRLKNVRIHLGTISDFGSTDKVELAVTALPAEAARPVVENLLRKGIDVVDISFTDYDPFELNEIAKEHGAVYVPHAGYAPGLSNILAGWLYYSEGSRDIEIIVGGLQEEAMPPMNYRPTFNPSSVIDEYTRPARYLVKGKLEAAEPLETVETFQMEGVGALESFYSDGLATLLDTMKDATVIEKTLRYPGHLDMMRFLRDMGYFSDEKIDGASPREISNGIFKRLAGSYPDLSILRVFAKDLPEKWFECVDHFDRGGNLTSMGRMTGFSAAAIAQAVHEGYVKQHGVFATEWIGRDRDFFERILGYLSGRGISIRRPE